MSATKKLAEFPDVEAKLQQPTKKSVFERQREEAEAKRRREEAETAAVLEDFVKSFERDGGGGGLRDSRPPPNRFDRPPPGPGDRPPASAAGSAKRHFGLPSSSQGPRSGPGSLGPAPTSFGRKRNLDGFSSRGDRDHDSDHHDGRGQGRLAFDDPDAGARSISRAFETSDDEGEVTTADRAEEKAVAKPTLRLSNLPPGTSPAVIKALVSPSLNAEGVKILPPAGPGSTERKSLAAIVTLSPDTAATDIDAAVSSLQNRYLGFGFYLSLHRHLSSAAISGALANVHSTSTNSHPFGAKPVPRPTGGRHGHRSGGQGRGFAPPSSYGPAAGGPMDRAGILHVAVQPPRDIKKLRTIHMVVESILEHGPEFEALLMSRPDVQRDEKWAWIWDARSEGGVWYRYKLWEAVTGCRPSRGRAKFTPIFEDSAAWKMPDRPLSYEFATGVEEFVSDSEYNSSDEDDFDDEPHKHGGDASGPGAGHGQDDRVLSPLQKAKLVHLLARLPTTLSKLRKGDIARVATFAITHASRGAEEIVDLIISNVERPFAFTSANPDFVPDSREGKERIPQQTIGGGEDSRPSSPGPAKPDEKPATAVDIQDHSAAKLIGLYVISDILSSSSTSGIRHAWRYRQHFETALRSRKVFEALGMVAGKLNWGRLRVEKWKRSVGIILSHWDGWCVFPAETQAFFVSSFENPPALLLKKEEEHQQQQEGEKAEDAALKKAGKWKTVDALPSAAAAAEHSSAVASTEIKHAASAAGEEEEMVADEDEHDVEDEPYMEYTDDEDLDLEILDEEDIDGEPMSDGRFEGVPIEDEDGDDEDNEFGDGHAAASGEPVEQELAKPEPPVSRPETKSIGRLQMSSSTVGNPKKRLRAVDMFADSDSEKD